MNAVIIGDVLAIEWDGSKITLDSLDLRDDYPKPEPIERTMEIQINGEGQVTRIGSLLNKDQKGEMEHFLKDNFGIFAWSTVEMPSISLLLFIILSMLIIWSGQSNKRRESLS